jgi:hypothetical protein
VGAAAPTAPLPAALSLSCRRLAAAGNQALGRWELPSPRLRSPLRSACLAGGSLPRATKCFGWRGLPPSQPRFLLSSACLADGSLPRATKRLASRDCRPHTSAFRCARLVLQTACSGNETIGRWGLPPPHPRFPLRSACLAGGSLPRVAEAVDGSTCTSLLS